MANLYTSGRFQGFDSAGIPLSFGLLYTYSAGTLTPKATYTTQGGAVANANPVILDSAGRKPVWMGTGSYRMILKTADGVTITDDDNISASGDSGSESALNFGAIGDGVTDTTDAIQAAADSGIAEMVLPDGVFMVTALSISSSLKVSGAGTIKQIAGVADNLITVSGTSTKVSFHGVTIDGNEVAQAALTNYASVKWTAIGSASDAASLSFYGVTFKNGRWADLTVLNDAARTTVDKLTVSGCKFYAGREGTTTAYAPRYIDIRSAVDYAITDNVFDFLGTPASFGRAGILAYDGFDTLYLPSRGIISGNHLNNIGRSEPTSTLGAIDLYDTGRCTTINGNMLVNPYGRGIQCKADSEGLSITGNVVDGLSGGTMNAQIVINASTRTAYEGSVTITGNTCIDSGWDGISLTTSNSDNTGFAKGIVVSANTIRNATRRGIGLSDVYDAVIVGNSIDGAGTGIYAQLIAGPVIIANNSVRNIAGVGVQGAANNTAGSIDILGNSVNVCTGRGIYMASGLRGKIKDNTILGVNTAGIEVLGTTGVWRIVGNATDANPAFTDGGTNSALYVGPNDFETPLTTTAHTVTIASGAITVTMPWHFVATEGAAASDDLDTINGMYDGYMLTLRPREDTQTVVLKDGTNLRLAGDFTMDNIQDSITLMFMVDKWVEISRSDNGA